MNFSSSEDGKAEDQTRPLEGAWAQPVESLNSADFQADINLNVNGRKPAGLLSGFGQLWRKTYTIHLTGVELQPEEVIRVWKEWRRMGNFRHNAVVHTFIYLALSSLHWAAELLRNKKNQRQRIL